VNIKICFVLELLGEGYAEVKGQTKRLIWLKMGQSYVVCEEEI
jgi:hypothetical protein